MQYIRTFQEAEQNAVIQMRVMGFTDAELSENGADGGVDVRAAGALAQVKWRGAAVSRDDVQKLFGARGADLAKKLLFFAASGYSGPAVKYADEHEIALFVYEPHGMVVVQNAAAACMVRTSQPMQWRSAELPVAVECRAASSSIGLSESGLRRLRAATGGDVYKAGRLAGKLRRTEQGAVEFRYLPEYLDSAGAPIASTLPLVIEPSEGVHNSVPPFFAGLLPEGARLAALRQAVGVTATDDDLSLLLAVGLDVPGDVQVFPIGSMPFDAASTVDLASTSEIRFAGMVDVVDSHSIPGVQSKVSASHLNSARASQAGRFILKLPQPDYPDLVANEAAHLAAARQLKIPCARAELVHDDIGTSGLLVRRFDRVESGGRTWSRLAFEDATQVLGLAPSAKYAVDAVEVTQALAGMVGAPLVAVRNLYLQFLFAWLTGNGDLHGKNVGVLRDSAGRWVIAPMYDIPCTLIYGDESMALPIAGRTKNLRVRHWLDFAGEIGLPRKAAVSAQRLALRAATAVDFENLPFTGSPKNRTVRELRLRRAELEQSFESR